MTAGTKERLHRLVDDLADEELPAAEQYLEQLRAGREDPVLRALLTAPLDDEPETSEERAAVSEAKQDLALGRVVSNEELRREFGW